MPVTARTEAGRHTATETFLSDEGTPGSCLCPAASFARGEAVAAAAIVVALVLVARRRLRRLSIFDLHLALIYF